MSGDWLKNTAWGLSGEVATRVAKLVQTLAIVRMLGPDQFGRYNHSLAIASLLGVFFDFGITTIALRDLSRNPRGSAFRLYGRLKVAASLTGLLLLVGWLALASALTWSEKLLVVGLGIYLATSDGVTYVFVAFRVQQEFWRETVWRSIIAIVQFLACVAVLSAGKSITWLVGVMIASNLVILPTLLRELSFAPAQIASFAQYRVAIAACLPVAGSVLVGSLYMNWDVVILGNHGTPLEVAWYSVAVKMVFGILIMPLNFLQIALLPGLAAAEHNGDPFGWRDRWWRGFVLGLAVGAALTIATAIAAESLLAVCFGPEFRQAAPVMVAFVTNCYFFYLYTPLAQYLVIRDRQRAMFAIQAFAAVLNFLTVPWLVARMGLWGCVLASGLTHGVIALGSFRLVLKEEPFARGRAEWGAVIRISIVVASALGLIQSGAEWYRAALAALVFLIGAQKEMRAIASLGFARMRRH